MGTWLRCIMLGLLVGSQAWSAVPPATVAKIIRIVAAGGDGKVNCLDPEVAAALSSVGVAADANAAIVYATSDKDVAKFAKQNKLVICNQLELIKQGAVIAIVAEGDRPVVYLSPANAAASNTKIPEVVMKMGKVVN